MAGEPGLENQPTSLGLVPPEPALRNPTTADGMNILRDSDRQPARDTARTAAILRSVAEGRSPATLRIFQPGPTVAFGRRDTFRAGFAWAMQVAERHGFEPVTRHAGGHAAAYDHDSVVIELARPEDQIIGGIETRFAELASLISTSLARHGVALELGELPGEYCPGRFSLHIRGGPKVAGIAQRIIKGASLTAAVLAVGSGDRLRAVTAEVYAALELPLDLTTVGAITDYHPSVATKVIADSLAELAPSHFGALPIRSASRRPPSSS